LSVFREGGTIKHHPYLKVTKKLKSNEQIRTIVSTTC
jgi:hypothetical protein